MQADCKYLLHFKALANTRRGEQEKANEIVLILHAFIEKQGTISQDL